MAKVGTALRFFVSVAQPNGAPYTGVAADMAVLMIAPDGIATDAPVISEVGVTGIYTFVSDTAFTIAEGVGMYGIAVQINATTPNVRDVGAMQVEFKLRDADDAETEAAAATRETTNTAEHDATILRLGGIEGAGFVTGTDSLEASQAEHDVTQAGLVIINADTDDIQTRLPAALVGGRMDSDVGNMQTDVVDANALAADAATEIADAVDVVLTSAHGAGAWTSLSQQTFVPVLGVARNITAGDRVPLTVHLEVNGERVALPDTAELAIDIRDRADASLNSVASLTPVAGSGEFAHEFDPIGFTAPPGDVISVEATITLSGFGTGTHVGQLEVAVTDLGV